MSLLAKKLKANAALSAAMLDPSPHILVNALAGVGKTTTLVEGLRLLLDDFSCPFCESSGLVDWGDPWGVCYCDVCEGKGYTDPLIPSAEQKVIWDSMLLSKGKFSTVYFAAFNTSIAEELKGRVPKGCDAGTVHSLGFRTIRKHFRVNVDEDKTEKLFCSLFRVELLRELPEHISRHFPAVSRIVALAKNNLLHVTKPISLAEILDLIDKYDIVGLSKESPSSLEKIRNWVEDVLEASKRVAEHRMIDFDDMTWLPFALKLEFDVYDILCLDELQDCTRAQQNLAYRSAKRIFAVGDVNQAIYLFAGADAEGMGRLLAKLESTSRGCKTYALTETRRCGHAIVREANRWVPTLRAYPSNPEGEVRSVRYDSLFVPRPKPRASKKVIQAYLDATPRTGDMILCRVNAPLVSVYFKLLRAGKKAYIKGRKLAEQLIEVVNKITKKQTQMLIEEFLDAAILYFQKAISRESAKSRPDESKLIHYADQRDCLEEFAKEAATASDIIERIDKIFSDETEPGITLSSIHRAKGTESLRVWLIYNQKNCKMPHPLAQSEAAIQQEYNILYIAVTRSKLLFTYVV